MANMVGRDCFFCFLSILWQTLDWVQKIKMNAGIQRVGWRSGTCFSRAFSLHESQLFPAETKMTKKRMASDKKIPCNCQKQRFTRSISFVRVLSRSFTVSLIYCMCISIISCIPLFSIFRFVFSCAANGTEKFKS